MNLSDYNKLDTDIRPNMHDTNQRTRNIPSFFESICNVMHTHTNMSIPADCNK